MRLLILAVLLSSTAHAGEPPAPDLSVTINDDLGEVAWRPKSLYGEGRWSLTPVLKGGVLALTETFPYPYPILKQSPFGLLGAKLAYSGALEATVVATLGGVNLRSHRLLDDPGQELGSTASRHAGRDISQTQTVQSLYADVGKTFEAGAGWKGALYASFNEFVVLSRAEDQPQTIMAEASVGTAWLHRDGPRQLMLSGSVSAEYAPNNLYRHDMGFEAAPAGRVGGEYSFDVGSRRYLAGLEADMRRADMGYRPYVGVKSGDTKAILALDLRKSSNDFYPDKSALALSLERRISPEFTAGVSARVESNRYAMAPSAETDSSVMAQFTWTPGEKLVVKSRAAFAANQRQEYEAKRDRDLNTAATVNSQTAGVRSAIEKSPTLKEFLGAYNPGSELGILAAAAEFTRFFGENNYNKDWNPPNLDSVDDIYSRSRGTYLNGGKDPILVCYGAAQYAAFMAEELGRRNGIPIQASGITVRVPGANGSDAGHAVAAIKTKEHGIVFADWGRLIPTYTYNTGRALRVYQALVGVPAINHQITDPNKGGKHVGYYFTEEGKLIVGALTFHGELETPETAKLFQDDPRGDRLGEQRFKDLLRKRP